MSLDQDRLFKLLPAIYRERDADAEWALKSLLQVVGEQVDVVERDIDQLYKNWFIETCEDWVVPYIGDLVGYTPGHDAGKPAGETSAEHDRRLRTLIPRREVANTIGFRRRRGTRSALEDLSIAVAGWPVVVVEFYRLLAIAQSVKYPHLERGRTVDVRQGDALELLGRAFETTAHLVDVRRPNSHRRPGRYSIPSIGAFVWRLRSYSVTQTPAYCVEEVGPHCYTFSVLGNDSQLYIRPQELTERWPHSELQVPDPIRRRPLERHIADYYGEAKSLAVYVGSPRRLFRQSDVVVADLTDWAYRAKRGRIAVDPVLGRISFPPSQLPKRGVWVFYHYGFSADIGGGEYERPIPQPAGATIYRVGETEQMTKIADALTRWRAEKPVHAVIEITDSGVYAEQIAITLGPKQTLQLRAADRRRPVIRLLDWQTDLPDSLTVSGEGGGCFTLDGFLVTGRAVQIEGDLEVVRIRHCTLVPGWGLHNDCEPRRPAEPSLQLLGTSATVTIDKSIVGTIEVDRGDLKIDPITINISDSVIDGTSFERVAIGAPEWPIAQAILTFERCTVFGLVQVHAIARADNSIFMGTIRVARRQLGCMRFCYVTVDSRTPRRYECQPDLVRRAAYLNQELVDRETLRVQPAFSSTRYGTPTYCRLDDCGPEEIKRGAEDESEMGVFHDLFEPQREANLSVRLEEFTPAAMDAGIIFAS